MRRAGRARLRAAALSADVPEYSGSRNPAATAESLRFLRAPGRLPAGRRLYVVGDIHGHVDRLRTLHGQIDADLRLRPVRSAAVVYLGDYLNQGPDPAGVVALLSAAPPTPGLQAIALLGDHERMLLDALDGDRPAATDFLWSGGRQTLASWGLPPDLPREEWAEALPADQLRWLRGLKLTHQEGSYLFVHAGVRPGIRLDDQTEEDLLTIRQPFLASEQDFGCIVVHGHASAPVVHLGPNRIGLDTGAGIGGKLTCAVLEDDVLALLAA